MFNLQSSLDILNTINNEPVFNTQEKLLMAESFRNCHNSLDVINTSIFWLKEYINKSH